MGDVAHFHVCPFLFICCFVVFVVFLVFGLFIFFFYVLLICGEESFRGIQRLGPFCCALAISRFTKKYPCTRAPKILLEKLGLFSITGILEFHGFTIHVSCDYTISKLNTRATYVLKCDTCKSFHPSRKSVSI